MQAEIRHWITTTYKGDVLPAFVDVSRGVPQIVVHAADFTAMTRAEAETAARERNEGQIARAEADVARLENELEAARRHLARTRAILQLI